MKILYYNWVDYLDAERRSGGVTVYQRNLMRQWRETDGVDAWFVASGVSYDLWPGSKPRWEKIRHGPSERRDRRFEIVNSETLAPSLFSFGNPSQIEGYATITCFCDFVAQKGPFDIIHFNNLEGVPVGVLDALKTRFPETKLVFSLHNYYPFCPQVNLWYRERALCTDYRDGRACHTCLMHKPQEHHVRQANAVAYRLKKAGIEPGSILFNRGFQPAVRLAWRAVKSIGILRRGRGGAPLLPAPHEDLTVGAKGKLRRLTPPGQSFARRRAVMVETINRTCDTVLGVSDRVSQIARDYGIDPAIVRTSYIGTNHADRFAETSSRGALPRADGSITLVYLGYMRRDKGFFFLLDALADLPADLARRIHLVVAAPKGSKATMSRLHGLTDRMASIDYADGYSHENLDAILSAADVGVVPVLWEDNLPQVAIEMHARHIPLLTSDRGGAQELGGTSELIFPAGDKAGFADRIAFLLAGQFDVGAYWANALPPRSMNEHRHDLEEIYARGKDRDRELMTAT